MGTKLTFGFIRGEKGGTLSIMDIDDQDRLIKIFTSADLVPGGDVKFTVALTPDKARAYAQDLLAAADAVEGNEQKQPSA
jgi:hypothetical protein